MTRTANAVWTGDLKGGDGRLNSQSTVLHDTKYSFKTRFENEPGTNPEELIAAAHAGCFAMATAAALEEKGITPQSVSVSCAVTMENLVVTKSALTLEVTASGSDETTIRAAADDAKVNCPISKALSALEITLDTTVKV